MICQAMNGNRLCTYDGIRTLRNKKTLCIIHIDAFFRDEQIKWAPKRLLQYELTRRVEEAVARQELVKLNEEYYNVR